MDVFSEVAKSRPRRKKEGRRSIALKMKRELPFLPSSFSLFLSPLSLQFSYPSAKKTSPRSIFNPAAKLFNWESFRRAIYKPGSKIRCTRDAWYIVGQDPRPLVVGWDGCSVAKPASGWRDLGGWAATCSGRNVERGRNYAKPRNPHCRVETLLNKESQLLITRERFYIHRFLQYPPVICQTFQPITSPRKQWL